MKIYNKLKKGKKTCSRNRYKSYQDYLHHQSEKTLDPERRKKWLGEEWSIKVSGFRKAFEEHTNILKDCKNALCLGARTGQEVQALRDMGIEAIGIDLVPCKPFVLMGDFHSIPFSDNSFDFAFSNSFDHVLYPAKFIAEVERVLRPGGYALLHLLIGVEQDEYGETIVKKSNEVIRLFKISKVVIDRKIALDFANLNCEILMKER